MSPAPLEKSPTFLDSENSREPRCPTGDLAPSPHRANGLFHNIDGGPRGWSTVLGSWLFQFSMIGTITAFGSYQSFYEDPWLRNYSESAIAWIGSLQLFLEFFLGVFGGLLLDGGHWRIAVGGGSFLFVFCFFMLSLCQEGQYAPILLSQGIGMGLGLGSAFLPISGIVAKHFTRRRSLAMGIITTGTSLGGFVFSVLASKLFQTNLGFSWTVRICAFIVLGCVVLGNVLVSEPEPSDSNNESAALTGLENAPTRIKVKPRSVSQLLRDPAYLAIISSGFIVALGLYFPMFAIQTFALEHDIPPGLADWLLSIMNLSGVLGRTIPNWLADHYGLLEFYVPCTAVAGALIFALGAATSTGSIIVVSILYGFFAGSIVSLYFPTVCALDPQVTSTGIRLGIACLPVGFAALVGTPITEAIVGQGNHWWYGIAFAGTAEMVSAALLAFAWVVERRREKETQGGDDQNGEKIPTTKPPTECFALDNAGEGIRLSSS
ncbi:putative Major facilitator superfamily (MFS) profile domain-containing protein [Seiridium cardinale]